MEKSIEDKKSKKIEKNLKNKNIKLYTYISMVSIAFAMLMVYLFNTYTVNDYVLLVVFSVLSAIAETFS